MGRDHRTRNPVGSGKPCSITARGCRSPSGAWPTTGTGSASGAGAAPAERIRHEAGQALSQEAQARYKDTIGPITGVEQVRFTFFRAPVPDVSRVPSCDKFRINVGAPHQIADSSGFLRVRAARPAVARADRRGLSFPINRASHGRNRLFPTARLESLADAAGFSDASDLRVPPSREDP